MSAFFCSDSHFFALAAYATQPQPHYGSINCDPRYLNLSAEKHISKDMPRVMLANFYVHILSTANAHSIKYRYKDNDNEHMTVRKMTNNDILAVHKIVSNPLQIIKLANSLDYQSCEDSDYWEHSKAKSLNDAIIASCIRQLPGYEDLRWSL